MANKNFYLLGAEDPLNDEAGALGEVAPAAALMSPVTGWVVGANKKAGQQASFIHGAERSGASWGDNLAPGAWQSNEIFRTPEPLTGTFAAGSWVISAAIKSTTSAFPGRVRLRWRVWRWNRQTGVRSEITNPAANPILSPATTANLATGSYTTLSAGWSAPEITLDNEYLEFAVGGELTAGTASGANVNNDINFGVGPNSRISTSEFTEPVPPTVKSSRATVSAFASLSPKPRLVKSSRASLQGVSNVSASPRLVKTSGLKIAGSGSLSPGKGLLLKRSGASVQGEGSISVEPQLLKRSSASIQGVGSISPIQPIKVKTSRASVFGSGEVEVRQVILRKFSSVNIVGIGDLDMGEVVRRSAVHISGGAEIFVTPSVTKFSAAAIQGEGLLVPGGIALFKTSHARVEGEPSISVEQTVLVKRTGVLIEGGGELVLLAPEVPLVPVNAEPGVIPEGIALADVVLLGVAYPGAMVGIEWVTVQEVGAMLEGMSLAGAEA